MPDWLRRSDLEDGVSTLNPPGGDPVEDLIDFLEPYIAPIIRRINVDEFTTVEFIQAMQLDPPTEVAYEEAIRRWPENNPDMAKMVIHGQVIPQLLRASRLVDWNGYAYGEDDPWAVAAWWKKITPA
ncbi:MAG TPA: hypothetical protein PLR44_02820 [Thermomicrobiales bacterium]|jgi:hypothetical protein|nr:hypothetical protein [Thermomicrobiales bacterium]